jgi:hypothetical protein
MTENRPVDRDKASKLANVLEGLNFPADKPKILSYVNQKLSRQRIDSDIIEKLQSKLVENKQFENVYEIEKQAGLVTQER